jgi:hypothetical protein
MCNSMTRRSTSTPFGFDAKHRRQMQVTLDLRPPLAREN